MGERSRARRFTWPVVVVAVLALAPTVATAAPTTRAATAHRWSGSAAISQLGDRLPRVAAHYGMSPAKLEQTMRRDATLHVDATDALYYSEPVAPAGAASDDTPIVAESDDDTDAFALHSRPGSSRVIYLDFNGQSLADTVWSDYYTGGACTAEAFNAEGSKSTFSTNEKSIVRGVWKDVAEDYAPFDVDVTTEDPGAAAIDRTNSSDTHFGTRALITTSASNCPNGTTLWESVCESSCGGIAYIGVYDLTGASHAYYQPALIFHNGLSNSPKIIGEAAAHEVGHNLGLLHDGTSTQGYFLGHNDWAPIMGAGYWAPVTQWSEGEYADANNTEDDFAIMQSYGIALAADDHGNTSGTATHVYAPSPDAQGTIGTRTDVDEFWIDAGAGPATFTVTPTAPSPDLDARLELRDDDGVLVAASDPPSEYVTDEEASGLDATITTTLTAGRYYLVVDGVGFGNALTNGYSDYASVGRYAISGSVPVPAPVTPSAPVAVSAAPGNGHAHVTWSLDDEAGSTPVTDYTVSVHDAEGGAATGVTGATTRNVGSDDTAFDFTGLSNGTEYLVTVAAVNDAGAGDESVGALVTPDGVAPITALSNPSNPWLLSTSIPVGWSATDAETGVANYDVQRRSAAYDKALGSYTPWKTNTTSTSGTYTGSHGSTYCFHARADDHAGNVGAYTSDLCTAVPMIASQLPSASNWTLKSSSAMYGGAYRTTTKLNASMSVTGVMAKHLALVATKCSNCGSVKVYWKGEYKKTISLKSSTTQHKQVIALLSFSGVSSGTLKFVVSTSGKTVSFEGLGVSKV